MMKLPVTKTIFRRLAASVPRDGYKGFYAYLGDVADHDDFQGFTTFLQITPAQDDADLDQAIQLWPRVKRYYDSLP